MSDPTKQAISNVITIITVIFAVFELIVASGAITLQQSNGFLSNLTQGGSNWYLNPIPWVIVLVLIVNFYGFVENKSITGEPWDIKQFAATWNKYLPYIVIFSQIPWAYLIPNLPADMIASSNIGITAAIALAIDIIKRAISNAGNGTTPVVIPTPIPTPA